MKFQLENPTFCRGVQTRVVFAEIKKYRAHIKKKSEQVARLKKKLYKNSGSASASNPSPSSTAPSNSVGGVADPSVQRLVESCTKELNGNYRTLRHAQVHITNRSSQTLTNCSIKEIGQPYNFGLGITAPRASVAEGLSAASDDGAEDPLLHVRRLPQARHGRGDGLLRGGRAARGRPREARKGMLGAAPIFFSPPAVCKGAKFEPVSSFR